MIFNLFDGARRRASALLEAAAQGDMAEVTALLDKRADLDAPDPETGRTPLLGAAAAGQWPMVLYLLRRGADASRSDAQGHSALHFAALAGDSSVEALAALLAAGAKVDAVVGAAEHRGATPLHLACSQGANACVDALLRAGASATHALPDGAQPVHTAGKGGTPRTLRLLMGAGAEVGSVDGSGWTPLHRAAFHGNRDFARALVEAGADIEARCGKALTPLIHAVLGGHANVASLLIDRGADPTVDGPSGMPLADAARKLNHVDAAQLIESASRKRRSAAKADRDLERLWNQCLECLDDDRRPELAELVENKRFRKLDAGCRLLVHCALANAEAVAGLLSEGADVETATPSGLRPLMLAARSGALDVVARLVEAGADLDAREPERGLGAFGIALDRGEVRAARLLFDRGASCEFGSVPTLSLVLAEYADLDFIRALAASGSSLVPESMRARAAFSAARNADPRVLGAWLELGADPMAGNELGYSPLILAALTGNAVAVRELLEKGADPAHRDIDGETALSLALEKRHEEIVDILLAQGAQTREYPREPGQPEDWAMLQAAADGALGTLLRLHESGHRLNPVDADGNTPLMLAARAGHHGVVRSLYHLGADPERRNHEGESALHLALAAGHAGIVASLREFGVLDALDDEMAEALHRLGAIVHDPQSMLCGRRTHPLKEQSPYDLSFDDEGSEDDESDDEAFDDETPEEEHEDDEHAAESEEAAHVMMAIVVDDATGLRRLLKAGWVPDQPRISGGLTPLMLACALDRVDLVNLLLKNGADPDLVDENGRTALEITLLRWTSADPDDRVSIEKGVLKPLLKLGLPADPGSLHEFVLGLVSEGHVETWALLKKHRVALDPDRPLSSGVTRLFEVALRGNAGASAARHLIACGANPNGAARGGMSVLALAARSNALELAEALVEGGADVLARNASGVCAIDVAALYGHHALARRLIELGNKLTRSIDRQDEAGDTALMRAVRAADFERVEALIGKGVDLGRRSLDGHTPLSLAVCQDQANIVRVLRAAGAQRSDAGGAIVDAARRGALGTVLDLLDAGLSVDEFDAEGNTAVIAAAGHPGLVRVLALKGADLMRRNQAGESAGTLATLSARTQMVETLRELGVAPEGEPDIAARHLAALGSGEPTDEDAQEGVADAIEAVDRRGVARLIEAGANVDEPDQAGNTPLSLAILGLGARRPSRRFERDLDQIIDRLLDAGANPDKGAHPPLVLAAMAGKVPLVNRLIRAGARVDAELDIPIYEDGGTERVDPLLAALRLGDDWPRRTERIGLSLLAAGAKAEHVADDGTTAAHLAARQGSCRLLGELVARAPQTLGLRDASGLTPLLQAASAGHADAVAMLLERGADPRVRDARGRTAQGLLAQAQGGVA